MARAAGELNQAVVSSHGEIIQWCVDERLIDGCNLRFTTFIRHFIQLIVWVSSPDMPHDLDWVVVSNLHT